MRFSTYLLLAAFLVLSACDSGAPPPADDRFPSVTYQTDGTDHAIGATLLRSGDLAVYGLTEGRTAPNDGTNAYPLLLRLRPNGTIASKAVYREAGFGRVAGAVPLNDGLAVLSATRGSSAMGDSPSLTLYRTDRTGTRKGVLYQQMGAAAPDTPLLRTSDGGFLLITFPFSARADNVIKLSADGSVEWTYRLPEAQDVRATDLAPNGDIFVLGVGGGSAFTVARLAPTGLERWRRAYGDDAEVTSFGGFAALDAGAAVLETVIAADTSAIRVTRLGTDGDVSWTRSYAEGRVRATALTTLTGRDLALAWTEDVPSEGAVGGFRAEIARLDAAGAVQARYPFGLEEGASTSVSALLPYSDEAFVATGSTGPERLSGFGGDDFDVRVRRYPVSP